MTTPAAAPRLGCTDPVEDVPVVLARAEAPAVGVPLCAARRARELGRSRTGICESESFHPTTARSPCR